MHREAGFTALQYWFFYPMNDWRSTFRGVNDHEADWEQVTVFVVEGPGGPVPAWVAFASHDEKGADLRRRWDDLDLQTVGSHPVAYVGAGSHSAVFLPVLAVVVFLGVALLLLLEPLWRVRRRARRRTGVADTGDGGPT